MRFDIITIFPKMFDILINFGVVGKAIRNNKCIIKLWNPRDFSENKNRLIDDKPYGGGAGMVMIAKPLENTIFSVKLDQLKNGINYSKVIMMSPDGLLLNHNKIIDFLTKDSLILLCGRYEAIDQRLINKLVDEEISVGDFVISGGELPAMMLIDAIIRQLPGVLNIESVVYDSFFDGLLDCSHYTRPRVFSGICVPDILISGNHYLIKKWRRIDKLKKTQLKRPDLINNARKNNSLSNSDKVFLSNYFGI